MNEKESVQLLQKLAYWLIRNGQTELSWDTAEDLIEQALPGMPDVACQGTASEILRHLLSRTGLLRAPTDDTVDFVHRTFQDFLGAKAAVESYDLPYIANQAHDEQWEDVVRMVVAHARPDERAKLLEKLIERGDREKQFSTRLRLLALACLQHATELAAPIRSEVQTRADLLLPPRAAEEVHALVQVGPVVLDLLPAPNDLLKDEIEPTISVAQRIGGDAALAYLKSFNGAREAKVLDALTLDWARFDAQEYVTEVLAPMQGPYESVFIEESQQAKEISRLHVTGIFYYGDHDTVDMADQQNVSKILDLAISSNDFVYDLQWISNYRKLEELRIYDCPQLERLDGLRGTTLTHLGLENMNPDLDVSALRELASLRSLELATELGYRDLGELPVNDDLEYLELGPHNFGAESIEGLSRWMGLKTLSLPAEKFTQYFVELLDMTRLGNLVLTEAAAPYAFEEIAQVPVLGQVTYLTIYGVGQAVDFSHIARIFPSLDHLLLVGAGKGSTVDISPLASLENVKHILIRDISKAHGSDLFSSDTIHVSPRPRIN
ncbi:NACHT domain-containing protein [Streptomyces sp. 7N604]|uniref:NACHT domain-containing protein n=1 Tax=Streptomyces sp. 7N604 TaxID=3457415 RepID=UPI003FD3065B